MSSKNNVDLASLVGIWARFEYSIDFVWEHPSVGLGKTQYAGHAVVRMPGEYEV